MAFVYLDHCIIPLDKIMEVVTHNDECILIKTKEKSFISYLSIDEISKRMKEAEGK